MRVIFCATILLALGMRASAQQAPSTAEETFRAFVADMTAGRFRAAAAKIYTPRLEENRLQALIGARHERPYVPTLADITRGDPDMPPAVAEYQLAQMKKHMADASARWLEYEWFGVRDTALLARLPIDELAVRWLQARDQRTMLRDVYARTPGCKGRPAPPDSISLGFVPNVIGVVSRPDTAWVLYRMEASPQGDFVLEVPPIVAPMIRERGRWYLWPSPMLLRGQGFAIAVSCDSLPR